MLKLRKVAITGGLSCGKSTVSRFFKEQGAHVVSADEIVHQLLIPTESFGQQVIELLGKDIVVKGKIDRSVIAKKVFEDKTLLRALEKLVHPIVLNEIENQYQQISNQGKYTRLFIAEIPLLFETTSDKNFDAIIAIWTNPEVAKQRFMKSTSYGENEYFKRMANQMPADEKVRKSDFVIDNSGTLEQTHQAVIDLFHKLADGS
jgi:dephospho-CoA kinase